MERQLIIISDHPTVTGLTRKAQVHSAINEYFSNAIILQVKVMHFDNNGDEVKLMTRVIQLIADNNTRVNPVNGVIYTDADKDESGEYPIGHMGEYDYLWNVVNVAKAYTQVELEDMYVSIREEKINQKLYND